MTVALIGLVGILVGVGVYLLVGGDRLRVVFGFVLLSGAANLVIMTVSGAGGLPPIALPGELTPPPGAALALPQALVLTAIVIGLGLTAFLMVLLQRVAATEARAPSDECAQPSETLRDAA
ncbi:MAG: multicomponent Na+:H+ antiporter subunit C [Myxococcota bacterium]|jgi:multicomponent Na+:H+ antiporter subunit C